MDFRRTTVSQLADDVANRRVSSRELVQAALDRIDEVNPQVNAFVAVDAEAALAEAAAIDERIARGEVPGPLTGIPIGVKDLEDAAGFRTTHGSRLFEDAPVATADSILVERMRASGCVVIGKTNTPEMGHKADTTNPLFGSTRNPWKLERSAGGSSGGASAAVAAGMVPLCTGSDGGGSIRIPSAVCGLSGLKPSLGRIPAGGPTAPNWGDMSTKGPMARQIRDVTLALDATVGPDQTDLRSLPMPEASWSRSLEDIGAPLRIGWSPNLGYADVDSEVLAICQAAVERLAGEGTEVVEIESVFPEDPVMDWIRIAMVGTERSVRHLRGTPDWEKLDPGHAALIDALGQGVTGADMVAAQDACHTANLRLVEVFHRVPLLVAPTVAGQTGPAGGEGTINGVASASWVGLTYPFNMTRSPAGTVCAGFTADGMPVGLQVIGPQHADVAVLRLIAFFEDMLGLDTVAPL